MLDKGSLNKFIIGGLTVKEIIIDIDSSIKKKKTENRLSFTFRYDKYDNVNPAIEEMKKIIISMYDILLLKIDLKMEMIMMFNRAIEYKPITFEITNALSETFLNMASSNMPQMT